MRWLALFLLSGLVVIAAACSDNQSGTDQDSTPLRAVLATDTVAPPPAATDTAPPPATDTPLPPAPTDTPVPPTPTAPPRVTSPWDTDGDGCHDSYTGACLDPNASDYDCAGGTGNGPNYTGPVRVVGPDKFDLDRDGDGYGCE